LKSKIGCQIVIFQPKLLIFSGFLDIFTLDLPVFEFSKNLFLSYSQETKVFFTITQEWIQIFQKFEKLQIKSKNIKLSRKNEKFWLKNKNLAADF